MKHRKLTIFLRCLFTLFLAACFVLFWAAKWYIRIYGNLGFSAILYTLTSSLGGVESGLVKSYLIYGLLPAVLCTVVAQLLLFSSKLHSLVGKAFKKGDEAKPFSLPLWLSSVVSLLICVGLVVSAAVQTEFPAWLDGKLHTSGLYESEYVEPDSVSITFPEEKRNLIYIFLESMEATYLSQELGGGEENDLIPELYELASENINFSPNDGVGGFYSPSGTGWTIAAMVAQTSGIPLISSIGGNDYGNYDQFLPGAVTINDILHENGYQQALMVGSDASFAGRDAYFSQHGVDQIYDLYTAYQDEIVPDGYYVWWGMEDKYLFQYAKQELLEMASSDEPFAFTMLTVDTHHIGGYTCSECGDEYEESYENAISCSSRQVAAFVQWIQEQDFYENTTIVICGDHPSMDSEYFDRNVDPSYARMVYNCIINSAVTTDNTKNRMFTTFDLFPTTLAAMGCEISGDRLGLGVNLFSQIPTLVERYGSYEALNAELLKSSDYYDNELLCYDDLTQIAGE
jgi:phosphoglycerol transferase